MRGLELGAEDYIVKPFHLKELLLRIENTLKRRRALFDDVPEKLQIGRVEVDFSRFNAGTHTLTHKECALLKLLVEKQGKVVSREDILDRVWSQEEYPTERTVDNFILKLRKLVEREPEKPQLIRSVRGVGYQLCL